MAIYRVTPAGAIAKDGSDWANAMGEAEFETHLEGSAVAGDIYYVASGAANGSVVYTLDSAYDSNLRDGTEAEPINIIGVKYDTSNEIPIYTDWPSVGSLDRPVFSGGTNSILFGENYKLFNLSFTHAVVTAAGVAAGGGGVWYNCKIQNTTATADKYALYQEQQNNRFISCEFISDAGIAAYAVANQVFLFCYFRDSVTGLPAQTGHAVFFCVFNTLSVQGIDLSDRHAVIAVNNTFYNMPTAINATTGDRSVFINNIIDNCIDAFVWTTQEDLNFFWQNHEGNSVTRMYDLATNKVSETAPHTDLEVTSGDPKFTAAGSDFSLASDSPCINAGKSIELGVG